VGDYLKLYVDTIYVAIGDVEGHSQRPFVDSSPSNGIISSDPYVKQWGTASTPHAGDTHFYDYSSDCEAYSMFPASKFVSEFGFQVHPSFLAYEPVTNKEDRHTSSKFSHYRQRHEDGNNQMEYQMERHFNLPVGYEKKKEEEEEECPDDGERGGVWDSYLYLSALQQSRCYETAINYWRSLRSDVTAQTMGILYWQMNDIWEGPSWASMEWGGRWKPLQYTVKRIFAEISTSLLGLPGADEVKIFGVNDLPEETQVTYSLYLIPWSQTQSLSQEYHLISTSKHTLTGGSSEMMELLSLNTILSSSLSTSLNCSRLTCFLYLEASAVNLQTSQLISIPPVSFPLETFKTINLTNKPQLVMRDFQPLSPNTIQFILEVDQVAPFLFMELTGPNTLVKDPSGSGVNNINAGWFSDNNFLALPGREYSLTYTALLPIENIEEWKTKLQIRSLQSVQTESCSGGK
jgi:beta-mannosidase